MCGIIGYTGQREASEVILEALRRLEYRGYDSAGIVIMNPELTLHKRKGELAEMQRTLPQINGHVGIGHTRWATCGKPSNENAHPFLDCHGRIALVHNGIIENYMALKEQLQSEGHVFTSQTDTEVIVHLIEKHDKGDLHQAVRAAVAEIKGTYAIACIETGSGQIVAARKENPLVLGLGVDENFVASDVTAMLSYTNQVKYVMDGETVVITPESVTIYGPDGEMVERSSQTVTWNAEDAQKGGFEHFMLKEIFEEPQAIHNSLLGALDVIENGEILPNVQFGSIKIIACGTSFHAAMVGKYALEELAKIPVTVELASEYRYSPGAKEFPLVVLITQSGETADTLAAAREAKRRGCQTLADHERDRFHHHPGGGRGVLHPGRTGDRRGRHQDLPHPAHRAVSHRHPHRIREAQPQPRRHVERALQAAGHARCGANRCWTRPIEVEAAVDLLVPARDVFFIGRNINYPTMLEGALKLKEISYIHAEGFAAGELKHGPLALLDSTTPVVAVALTKDHTYDKMMANISEVAARDSPVLAIGCEGDKELPQVCRSGAEGSMRRPAVLAGAGDGGAAAHRVLRRPEKRLLHRQA